MESRTELSFSGVFGYRFSRVVGFEIETTVVPSLKSPYPGVTIQDLYTAASPTAVIQIYPAPTFTLWTGMVALELIFKALAQGVPERLALSWRSTRH